MSVLSRVLPSPTAAVDSIFSNLETKIEQAEYLIKKEIGPNRQLRGEVPLPTRVQWYRHGHTTLNGVLYGFDQFGYSYYVSKTQKVVKSKLNTESGILFENKLYFHLLFDSLFEDAVPELFAVISGGEVIEPGGETISEYPIKWLETAVEDRKRIVVKDATGSSGRGVFVLSDTEEVTTIADAIESDRFVVTEFIEQHEYAEAIYPNSVNTIRILTFWDYEADEPYVADAVHRFGTKKSEPIDNFGSGGLSVGIDLVEGTLQRGAVKPKTAELDWHTTHPDTESQIQGIQIPNWTHVKATTVQYASHFPEIPMVGWDVVVTRTGITILEANAKDPDFKMMQMHRPLLKDNRNRQFLNRHGVI